MLNCAVCKREIKQGEGYTHSEVTRCSKCQRELEIKLRAWATLWSKR